MILGTTPVKKNSATSFQNDGRESMVIEGVFFEFLNSGIVT